MDTCYSLHICPNPCTRPRVDYSINYGPWMFTMSQSRFNNYNECTPCWGNFDNGRGYSCVEVGGIWVIFVPSLQFCCEPKAAPKQ